MDSRCRRLETVKILKWQLESGVAHQEIQKRRGQSIFWYPCIALEELVVVPGSQDSIDLMSCWRLLLLQQKPKRLIQQILSVKQRRLNHRGVDVPHLSRIVSEINLYLVHFPLNL